MASPWVEAARPRTLPLALSSIFMGSFTAAAEGFFNPWVFGLACLTTIFLQVLSNFANDYGDTQNGADLAGRIGPARAVQTGVITPQQMFRAIVLFAVLSLFAGIALLWIAFGSFTSPAFLQFLGLGVVCIIAAYTYTAGKNPYGYAGLGDISVFLFFGLVGVIGSYYLYSQTLSLTSLLPALSSGFFATGVLNINNIRDIDSDTRAGKKTIPARFGKQKAFVYHWFLLFGGMITALLYVFLQENTTYWFLLSYPLFLLNGYRVSTLENPDPMLKQLALSTLIFTILFGISLHL
ncbi:MAG: 1,4-dihydroxy-2-naphthoate polyprenyltransferase [Spirosomataceae bacterium]